MGRPAEYRDALDTPVKFTEKDKISAAPLGSDRSHLRHQRRVRAAAEARQLHDVDEPVT